MTNHIHCNMLYTVYCSYFYYAPLPQEAALSTVLYRISKKTCIQPNSRSFVFALQRILSCSRA